MMIRWQCQNYEMSTLGDLEEVTLIGVYGIDEGLPDIKLPNNGDYGYNVRGPVNNGSHTGEGTKAIALVMVRFKSGGIAQVYELRCINAWLMDDSANTIDKYV